MNTQERDDLRTIQDRVIDYLSRHHDDDTVVIPYAGFTVADMRTTLYPDYAHTFRAFLANLARS